MKLNVIIVLIDSLRAKNLSLFGYPKEFDTNIKKIASESTVFSNHFSASNATYPSITSLFTGKYPINNGIVHTYPWTPSEEINRLKQNKFWLPSYLRKIGYDTFFISLSGVWLKNGFEHIQEEIKKDAYKKITSKTIIKKTIKLFPNWFYVLLKKIIKRDPESNIIPGEKIVDSSISKIKSSKKPFFMFIHFEDVHYPWSLTRTPNIKGQKTVRKILKELDSTPQKKEFKRSMFNVRANSLEQVEAKYNLSIKSADNEIGRFYNFLKKEKLLDNSIFILLGDHGMSIDEHFYLSHTGLYDELIKVPLIIRFPGIKPRVISNLVQNIDIAPTILDIINKKENLQLDGGSLLAVAKTGKSIRDKIFAFDALSEKRWCVRTINQKIIFSEGKKCFSCKGEHGEEIEAYNLKKDTEELNNLYSDEIKLMDFNPNFNYNKILKYD